MVDKAVALKYDPEENKAPKVLASGKMEMAKKIVQKAKEHNIAIFANEELVSSLIDLEVDKEIPPELYRAVVEVFVWLNKLDKRYEH